MLDKLAADSTKISTPTRDDVMRVFCSAWDKMTSDLDIELAINSDGLEDDLVKTSLSTLVMEEIKMFRAELLQ